MCITISRLYLYKRFQFTYFVSIAQLDSDNGVRNQSSMSFEEKGIFHLSFKFFISFRYQTLKKMENTPNNSNKKKN